MSIEKFDDKSNWLDSFQNERPDLMFPDSWSESDKVEAAELVRPSRSKTNMFASIPMMCRGNKCPVAEICPLLQKGLNPSGKPCPIEMGIVKEFMLSIMNDLNVDPENLIEVSMVRDLVNQEIQKQRAVWKLSMEDFIQENVVGIDNSGEPIFKKELHLAVDLEDRIHRRQKDLRNQLLATREARAKVGQGNVDTTQAISKMIEAVREFDLEKDKLIRKRLGTSTKDDYIQESSLELDIIDLDSEEKWS